MVSSKVCGYIKRITIELKYMAMKLKHRPGGLTRKRPGHNIITYSQYTTHSEYSSVPVDHRQTITASGAILIKRGAIV